jgi:hypothetical protein
MPTGAAVLEQLAEKMMVGETANDEAVLGRPPRPAAEGSGRRPQPSRVHPPLRRQLVDVGALVPPSAPNGIGGPSGMSGSAPADRARAGSGLAGSGPVRPRCRVARALRLGAAEQGTVLSEATMSRALARLGWALKKSRSMPASAMKPPARRGVPATVDPSRLVFVDECGTHIALTRLRARAPRRPIGRVPRSHEPNLTLFAALTPQGMGPPLVVEGRADHAVMMHGCRCLWEGSITMGVEPAHEA